jgi:transcriptional regulator with XRE-family HTH domain/Zn-dependent peptidase ImmA (M78 family)
METVESWAEVGERIAEARLAAGLSQGELASQLGLDRTAVVRIEAGERRITALELFRLAEALGVPLAHMISRPPATLVSRRTALEENSADAVSRDRYRLDARLEEHARNAAWLVGHGFLSPPTLDPALRRGSDTVDPVALAVTARACVGAPTGPLGTMVDVLELFGLYLTVADEAAEGASLLCDGYGVAVISGRAAPGRRRWTAAHELGHYLLSDEYHNDAGLAASRDDREQLIDRFAGEFLLPAGDLRDAWTRVENGAGPRSVLIDVAAAYRLSWGAVVNAARQQGLLDAAEARRQRSDTPQLGEFVAAHGHGPEPDLEAGITGALWRKAALAAYLQGTVTAPRVIELLYNALTKDELPRQELEEPLP